MLTFDQLRHYIELAEYYPDIRDMTISTGSGLLRDTSTREVYMGIEGHKKYQSEESLHGWNWKLDPEAKHSPEAPGQILHRHGRGIKRKDGDFHSADITHYNWEVEMINPLELQIIQLKNGPYGASPMAFFRQTLTQPTPMFYHYEPPDRFTSFTTSAGVHIQYNGMHDYVSPTPDMSSLYGFIWKECIKVYYLKCQSLPLGTHTRLQGRTAYTMIFDDPIPTAAATITTI